MFVWGIPARSAFIVRTQDVTVTPPKRSEMTGEPDILVPSDPSEGSEFSSPSEGLDRRSIDLRNILLATMDRRPTYRPQSAVNCSSP